MSSPAPSPGPYGESERLLAAASDLPPRPTRYAPQMLMNLGRLGEHGPERGVDEVLENPVFVGRDAF